MPQKIITTISNTVEDDVQLVGVYNDSTDYMLWQKSKDSDEIHFECDDQGNGGYDCIKECLVHRDGIHISLNDAKFIHFYFYSCSKESWEKFSAVLREIYKNKTHIIEILY